MLYFQTSNKTSATKYLSVIETRHKHFVESKYNYCLRHVPLSPTHTRKNEKNDDRNFYIVM